MRSPLETRISVLRAQVRRLLALHGLSWVVAGLVLMILLAGLLDWLFHLSREVRVIELVALLGVVGWMTARLVVAPLVVRFLDLDIALRIEERWPGLHDRLATTLQFLAIESQEREDVHGSRQLREETIRRTLEEAESIDFRTVVDPRPARSAMISAALPVLLGLVLIAAAPSTCKTALDRLFSPLGSARWPKQTHLSILEPNHDGRKIARGEPFLLEVGVGLNEALPSDGVVRYTFENGETLTHRLGTKLGEKPRLVDRIAEVNRSFRYSVSAGDDTTPIQGIVVVPPPSLVTARVTLKPPAYSGEPISVVEPASGKTMLGVEFDLDRVLQGTEVVVEARANKPIASSTLNLLGSAPWEPEKTAQTATETMPTETPLVSIGSDGQSVAVRFVARSSGRFSFDLTDTEGFRNQERESLRFQLNSQADLPPQVILAEPPGNRDVTANALVPFLVQSEDDFGLGKVWLSSKVSVGGSEPVDRDPLVLWVPDTPEVSDSGPAHKPTRKLETPYSWDLSKIEPALEPGSVLTVHAAAVDLDSLGGPKTGKSREITLRILAPEQVAEQLEEQRRAIREEIARAKDVQNQAITPVQDAKRTLRQVDQLPPQQRDDLTNAETIQRQVSGRVSDRNEGLIRKVERFLEDQQNLKLDNPDTRDQMKQVLAGLERIRDHHLNPAEQSLTRANKALDQNNPDAQPQNQQGEQGNPDDGQQAPQQKGQQGPKGEQGQQENQAPQQKGQQGQQSDQKGQQAPQQKGQQGPQGDQAQQKGQQADQKGEQGQQQKGQQPPENEPTRAGQELARAEQEQKAIAQEFEEMLQDLNEFETARGLAQEAGDLLKEQKDAMKATAEAAEKHALEGKMPDQVEPEAKAELDNLAARQEQIGEKLAQLENKMSDLAKRDQNTDPLAAEALAEASRKSRARQTAEKARQAGEQVAQNQTGRARETQKQVERDLQKLLDNLQNRRENDLRHLISALKQTQKELDDLKARQEQNRKNMAAAGNIADPEKKEEELQRLAKEQKKLEKELRDKLLKLEKLSAAAARAGQKAAQAMARAGEEAEQGDADEAEDDQKEAENHLENTMEQIEEAVREAEEQLAMEQLSRIRDDLANLGKRQTSLVAEVEKYGAMQEAGDLNLPRKKSVVGLGRAEEGVRDETSDLVERLDAAPVYAQTLKRAAEAMTRASEKLRGADPGADAQRDMKLAARRFEQLLDSLRADEGEGQGGQQGDQQGGQQGQRMAGDGIPTAAQLKMLKFLQEEINTRTEEIDLVREKKKVLPAEMEEELGQLEEQQRNVADLARDLTRPRHDDGEE